jgi:hypothetical protein
MTGWIFLGLLGLVAVGAVRQEWLKIRNRELLNRELKERQKERH